MQAFVFLLVSVEMLLVDFMNKDFVGNVWLDLVCVYDQFPKPHARVFVVLGLRIYHIN